MLYEPFPGGAAVVLTQLGLMQEGQAEGLGVRSFDAESGRLSLAMSDGRVVELVRATHARTENRYAVLVRTDGYAEDRGLIQIDRDFGVTNLLSRQIVYPETARDEHVFEDATEGLHDDAVSPAGEDETMRIHAVKRPVEAAAPSAVVEESETEIGAAVEAAEIEEPVVAVEALDEVGETKSEDWEWAEPVSETKPVWEEPRVEMVDEVEAEAESEAAAEPESAPNVPDTEAENASSVAVEDASFNRAEDEAVPIVETEALAEAEAEVEMEAAPTEPDPAVEDEDEARTRYYRPLVEAFEPEVVVMFGWVAETGTIQTYEHRATGRYMHIDGASGLFYDQTRTPISRAAALRHVMPTDSVREQAKAAFFEEPRAAEKPAETPAVLATRESVRVADETPHGEELGLDIFVRKTQEEEARVKRESWRDRLGRTFRMGKNREST